MARTLIVIDPMGMNLVGLGLQYLLLKGTLVRPGDTVYRLPYVNYLSGIEYIEHGAELLDEKLSETAGDILVFAYSNGCHVATKWLQDYGTESPITPTSRLSFLFVGNPGRRYGGFCYGHETFDPVAVTDGLPAPLEDGTSTVHYALTDFTRQYDGVADFPNAPNIQDAIESIGGITTDPFNWMIQATQDIINALIGVYEEAAWNALIGMTTTHNNYFNVTPDDQHNVRMVDPDHPLVEYVWSPTYPVPILGALAVPSVDRNKRTEIETAFARPVALPKPNYAQISIFTKDFFATDDDNRRIHETGWYPEPKVGVIAFTPGAATLTITGGQPTINLSVNQALTPGAASLTITGGTPTIGNPKALAPGSANLTITGGQPTIAIAIAIAPAGATLTITGGAPELHLTSHLNLQPGAAALTITGGQATVTNGSPTDPYQAEEVTYSQSTVYPSNVAADYAGMNDGLAIGNDDGEPGYAQTGTNQGIDQWIMAELESAQDIDHIVIGYDYTNTLPGGWGVNYTEDALVQGSLDGSSWTTIDTTPDYASTGSTDGLVSIEIGGTWKYIRLLRDNGYLALLEFQIWVLPS